MLKYIPQYLIRCYFPYNIAQVKDTFTQILGDEVSG